MIRFSDKAIIFTTFYFEEEIKNSDIIEDYTYSEKELNLAIELIKSMTDKFKPETLGQASRIDGVSPSDINVLMIYLKMHREHLILGVNGSPQTELQKNF